MAPLLAFFYFCSSLSLSLGCGIQIENPVLNVTPITTRLDPAVIVKDGTYYVVVTLNGTFVAYKSKDLIQWEPSGPLVTPPPWSNFTRAFTPSIYVSKTNKIRMYYSTLFERYNIRTAYASDVFGPYYPLEWPLMQDNGVGYKDPKVFEDDDGTTYLYYNFFRNYFYVSPLGRDLTTGNWSRGYQVLEKNLSWETFDFRSPYMFKKDGTYYLFYASSWLGCHSDNGISVARGSNPFGPFEKLGHRLDVSAGDDKKYIPSSPNVVKDPNGDGEILFYEAGTTLTSSTLCSNVGIFAKRLSWGADGWPYIQ